MKILHLAFSLVLSTNLVSCGAEPKNLSSDSLLTAQLQNAEILSSETIECYCCPGYTLALNDQTFFVDELPNNAIISTAIVNGEFPIPVQVTTVAYSGQCPGRVFSIGEIQPQQTTP